MVKQSELDLAWTMVADDAGLASAARTLAEGTGPVGIDTERASGFRYGGEAYLVQVFRRGAGVYLFDPTLIGGFGPLRSALDDVEWVLHAATQDIPCLDDLGLHPPRLFDTELAARLLGFERVGLGSLVEAKLGVTLEKAHSAADWSKRPLPDSWLEYAALDVALLPDLRDAIAADLSEAGKETFARQEFDDVLTRRPKPRGEQPWRRLSGLSKLRSPRDLAVARELWKARDALARERDIAPGRLLPDSSIIAAAAAGPRSPGALAGLKTFTGRTSRSELDRWWAAVMAGKNTQDLPELRYREPGTLPQHRSWSNRYPEAAARLQAARTALDTAAEELRIPRENLLTPEVLRRVSWQPPEPITAATVSEALAGWGAREWQREICAPLIAHAFVGKA